MRCLVLLALLTTVGCGDPVARPVAAPAPQPAEPEFASLEEVKRLLGCCEDWCGLTVFQCEAALTELGDRAFPAYELILADPTSEPAHVRQACYMIAKLQTDRSRFVRVAVRRVTEPDALVNVDALADAATQGRSGLHLSPSATVLGMAGAWMEGITDHRETVRESAIKLLGAIGDDRDANVLVPFLSNNKGALRYAAADALAKIGGKPELAALDACLKPGDPRRDANELRHLKERRDELEARLKANPVPKHLTN